jgi:hypothetical protein
MQAIAAALEGLSVDLTLIRKVSLTMLQTLMS